MKTILTISLLTLGRLFAQDPCNLKTPDSLTTNPAYNHIFQGDAVTFTAHGTCDSSSWFALYGEECCVERLDSNKTGVFMRTVWASDIFYVRIESYCDTTWGVSIDIDAYPTITGIEETPIVPHPKHEPSYDLLGRIIPDNPKGFFVRKRKLFFE